MIRRFLFHLPSNNWAFGWHNKFEMEERERWLQIDVQNHKHAASEMSCFFWLVVSIGDYAVNLVLQTRQFYDEWNFPPMESLFAIKDFLSEVGKVTQPYNTRLTVYFPLHTIPPQATPRSKIAMRWSYVISIDKFKLFWCVCDFFCWN